MVHAGNDSVRIDCDVDFYDCLDCPKTKARKGMTPEKSLEPTAAPLPGLARLSFRAAGSRGCDSALAR